MAKRGNGKTVAKGPLRTIDPSTDEGMLELVKAVGVPDDLPEIALQGDPSPPEEALARINRRTMGRLNSPGGRARPFRTALLKAAAAAAAVLLFASLAVAWAGPAQVWAGVQKALSLVPGFGLFDRAETAFTLFAPEKVRVEYGGGYLDVTGLMARPESTYLNLYFYRVPGFYELFESAEKVDESDGERHLRAVEQSLEQYRQIYLLDGAGRAYRYQEAGLSWWAGHREASLSMELPPLDGETGLVTLVVPLPDGGRLSVEIPLVSLDEIDAWGDVANIDTRQGVSVSAAANFGTDTRLSLMVAPAEPSASVREIGLFSGDMPGARPVSLSGHDGRHYSLRRVEQGWHASYHANYRELIFEAVDPAEQAVTLTIPVLRLREPGEGRAAIPLPEPGSAVELDREVSLGRFSFTLTRAEIVAYPYGEMLRVYVDLGPAGAETLDSFTLGAADLSKLGSFYRKTCAATGRMEYFELPLEKIKRLARIKRSVKLTFTDPVYAVEGPWTFTFPVEVPN